MIKYDDRIKCDCFHCLVFVFRCFYMQLMAKRNYLKCCWAIAFDRRKQEKKICTVCLWEVCVRNFIGTSSFRLCSFSEEKQIFYLFILAIIYIDFAIWVSICRSTQFQYSHVYFNSNHDKFIYVIRSWAFKTKRLITVLM